MDRENDIIEAGTDFEIIDENNELILSNDNGEYPFRRVDFDDYSSIVNYGSDILAKIQELSITHAEMVENQGVADSLDDELRGISNFSQQIERSEIKKDEKKEAKGLQKGWLMVTGMFKKKEKEQLDVNHRSYQDYVADLNQIAMSIERDKDSTLKIIALDAEFTKQMNPLIENLKLAIEVGEKDLANYEENVFKIREEAYKQNPDDPSIRRKYNESNLIVKVFKRTLLELNKGLAKCEHTLSEMTMSQEPNMNLLVEYNTYLKTTQPFLYLQGKMMVELQRQRDKINIFNKVTEATNSVYVENAEMLLENIEDAGALSEQGGMSVETIKKVDELITEGIKLIEDNSKRIEAKRKEDMITLNEIVKNIDESREKLNIYMLEGEQMGSMEVKTTKPIVRSKKRGKK